MTDSGFIEKLNEAADSVKRIGVSHRVELDTKDFIEAVDLINRQKAEIERLQKAIKVQDIMIEQQDYKIKSAKSEARKELAERLKEQAALGDYPWDDERVYLFQIDNLLAEMTDPTITKVEHNSLCETETYRKGEL